MHLNQVLPQCHEHECVTAHGAAGQRPPPGVAATGPQGGYMPGPGQPMGGPPPGRPAPINAQPRPGMPMAGGPSPSGPPPQRPMMARAPSPGSTNRPGMARAPSPGSGGRPGAIPARAPSPGSGARANLGARAPSPSGGRPPMMGAPQPRPMMPGQPGPRPMMPGQGPGALQQPPPAAPGQNRSAALAALAQRKAAGQGPPPPQQQQAPWQTQPKAPAPQPMPHSPIRLPGQQVPVAKPPPGGYSVPGQGNRGGPATSSSWEHQPVSPGAGGFGGGMSIPPGADDPGAGGPLIPCHTCGRSFNAQALQKHAKVSSAVILAACTGPSINVLMMSRYLSNGCQSML